jgi:heme A synthase
MAFTAGKWRGCEGIDSGRISDRTTSCWGARRPYLLVARLAVAILFAPIFAGLFSGGLAAAVACIGFLASPSVPTTSPRKWRQRSTAAVARSAAPLSSDRTRSAAPPLSTRIVTENHTLAHRTGSFISVSRNTWALVRRSRRRRVQRSDPAAAACVGPLHVASEENVVVKVSRRTRLAVDPQKMRDTDNGGLLSLDPPMR